MSKIKIYRDSEVDVDGKFFGKILITEVDTEEQANTVVDNLNNWYKGLHYYWVMPADHPENNYKDPFVVDPEY